MNDAPWGGSATNTGLGRLYFVHGCEGNSRGYCCSLGSCHEMPRIIISSLALELLSLSLAQHVGITLVRPGRSYSVLKNSRLSCIRLSWLLQFLAGCVKNHCIPISVGDIWFESSEGREAKIIWKTCSIQLGEKKPMRDISVDKYCHGQLSPSEDSVSSALGKERGSGLCHCCANSLSDGVSKVNSVILPPPFPLAPAEAWFSKLPALCFRGKPGWR